ncbi:MAG TPA: 2OG-Fe(II) oxygenase [Hyphomicrobiaceae bacterium]|nr:2OG-Fe(II) oxygenase [Hyphomicrobiaceae bacterium]
MHTITEALCASIVNSFDRARLAETPFPHWLLEDCLPPEVVTMILALPFEAPDLNGVSGKRELHNATRIYFDAANRSTFPVCAALCGAFQDGQVCERLARRFGAKLSGTYLRIEYAQDTDGFWLEPHTDIGVKVFTMLLYLSRDKQHATLGTDLYDADKVHVGCVPFASNAGMVFIPSGVSYHGFERRKIVGVSSSTM